MPATFNPDTDIPDLTGRVILVTGGTAGLGKRTIHALAAKNPEHIYFTGRNAASASSLVSSIGSKITFIECDLSSLASVRAAAAQFTTTSSRLDVLFCNAGIMALPPALSADGYELQFATNHLGHAALTKLLLPTLQRTARAANADVRVIYASSLGFTMAKGIAFDSLDTPQSGFGGAWTCYGQSKLANVLYAQELARRYPEITVVSIHPGIIGTGLVGNMSWVNRAIVYATSYFSMVSEDEGVKNGLWAATADKAELATGQFYEPVGVVGTTTAASQSRELAAELWAWTDKALEGVELL